MPKNPWLIESARLNGKRVYRAFRKRDRELFAGESNREYAGDWCTDRAAVESLAAYLNAKAEEEEADHV